MTDTPKAAEAAPKKAAPKADEELGYFGTKVDPRPNSDYSLESGPDSPPYVPDDRTPVAQPHAA